MRAPRRRRRWRSFTADWRARSVWSLHITLGGMAWRGGIDCSDWPGMNHRPGASRPGRRARRFSRRAARSDRRSWSPGSALRRSSRFRAPRRIRRGSPRCKPCEQNPRFREAWLGFELENTEGRSPTAQYMGGLIDKAAASRNRHILRLPLIELGCGGHIGAVADLNGENVRAELGAINLLDRGELESDKKKPIVPISGPMPWVIDACMQGKPPGGRPASRLR